MGDLTVVAFGVLALVGLVLLGVGALRRSRNLMLLGGALLLSFAGAWVVGLPGTAIGIAALLFVRRAHVAHFAIGGNPMPIDDPHRVTTLEALEKLYDAVNPNSLKKEVPYLHPHYRAFIEASPFAIIATSGPGGLDASPKGDAPGFVAIEDDKTLLVPDRKGNNRLDGLRNLVIDPRIALIFLVPGVGETLRVIGRADISVDPLLLARFVVRGSAPRSVLVVHVESVYFHCSKALVRSNLWDPGRHVERKSLPSAGDIISALTRGEVDGVQYDREAPARLEKNLY